LGVDRWATLFARGVETVGEEKFRVAFACFARR
jgi:hypothetical protein